ncbi:hypothetical protein [Aliagarivorans marinus]|uniref:hypothetical protein n=1 Tax=Aliagarivorans marinus TaxID=561965 RepID=UPI0004787FE1|nr:hypothetical protein [Aliagarivorans marinus]
MIIYVMFFQLAFSVVYAIYALRLSYKIAALENYEKGTAHLYACIQSFAMGFEQSLGCELTSQHSIKLFGDLKAAIKVYYLVTFLLVGSVFVYKFIS